MKIIIFYFEVFTFDTLFGALIVENNKKECYQTWNLEFIKKFYSDNKDEAIWIGHNSQSYDSIILEAIINNKTEQYLKKLNDDLLNGVAKRYSKLKMYQFDLMKQSVIPYSLKSTAIISCKSSHLLLSTIIHLLASICLLQIPNDTLRLIFCVWTN